jgi:Transposase IS4
MIYTGKSQDSTGISTGAENNGLGLKVLTPLLSCLEDRSCHEVLFDNYFTSYDLLVYLQETDMKATGTAREKRLKSMSTSIIKKMIRGMYDSRGDTKVSAVKWNDNQCVVVATN